MSLATGTGKKQGQDELTVHRDGPSGRFVAVQTVGFGAADVALRQEARALRLYCRFGHHEVPLRLAALMAEQGVGNQRRSAVRSENRGLRHI